MKKSVLFALVFFAVAAQAKELLTFTDITSTLGKGKPIHFVVNVKDCKSEMPLGSATIFLTPNAVMVTGSNRITASDQHFTLDNPISRGIPVYDYSKFNINADGVSSIKVTVMNASNYEKLASYLINCDLGEGFKVFD